MTRCFTGKTLRTITNEYALGWEKRPQNLKKFPEQILVSMEARVLNFISAGKILDAARQCMPAERVSGMIHEVKPAADIPGETVDQAERVLKENAGLIS